MKIKSKRLLLDTCVIIDLMTDPDSLSQEVYDIINDPEYKFFLSSESMRELVVSFNNKNFLPKFWKTSEEMLRSIMEEMEIGVLPVTEQIILTYSRLRLNTARDHKDPSDHVIISHAITEHITLLSSDDKFPFYRTQGLELIEY